jgi:hypothetical protein
MSPRVGGLGRRGKARGWRAADQARPALLLPLLLFALPACEGRLAQINPVPAIANVFGAHLEGREPPPGLDRPWPKLSSVPDRPVPPDPATRERISAGLAEDRQNARSPVAPGGPPSPPAGEVPPAPPRLAAVPPIRFEPAPAAQPLPAAQPVPRPEATPAPTPAAAPRAVAPDPVAPPPPPSRDLLAPPPAPSADLFAPPPAPSPDLLAPRRE